MTRPDHSSGTNNSSASRAWLVSSGVDLVGIARIERLLEEFDRSFADRVFTPEERAYCEGRPDPAQHYAARWAAKESFRKAVASDGPNVPYDAVGVVRDAEGSGPTLALSAPAETALARTLRRENAPLDRAATSVSLAHDRPAGYAIAHVLVGVRHPTASGTGESHGLTGDWGGQ